MNTKPMIIETQTFEDFRGYLSVPYDGTLPFDFTIRQINQGYSKQAFTLRGLHFQAGEHAQAKLVSCLRGKIFNVAVDLRPGENFGRAYSAVLSFENRKQMYIPRGFAHGYLTLEDDTLMQWCVDSDFCAESAKCVKWDSCGIEWPGKAAEYIISDKDKNGIRLQDSEISQNAERIKRYKERKQAIADLKKDCTEENLWKCIIAFRNYPFYTVSGLPFTYTLKVGRGGEFTKELFISRRENSKSLAWSSVKIAFERAVEKQGAVFDRPKAIADVRGVSYSYSFLWRFGVISVPEEAEEKLRGKRMESYIPDNFQPCNECRCGYRK